MYRSTELKFEFPLMYFERSYLLSIWQLTRLLPCKSYIDYRVKWASFWFSFNHLWRFVYPLLFYLRSFFLVLCPDEWVGWYCVNNYIWTYRERERRKNHTQNGTHSHGTHIYVPYKYVGKRFRTSRQLLQFTFYIFWNYFILYYEMVV